MLCIISVWFLFAVSQNDKQLYKKISRKYPGCPVQWRHCGPWPCFRQLALSLWSCFECVLHSLHSGTEPQILHLHAHPHFALLKHFGCFPPHGATTPNLSSCSSSSTVIFSSSRNPERLQRENIQKERASIHLQSTESCLYVESVCVCG